jgi:hypothetical protein
MTNPNIHEIAERLTPPPEGHQEEGMHYGYS